MAARVKKLPDYFKAYDSALSAMLRLYAQTTAAQVGLGKTGQAFRWDLGLYLIRQGFITEIAGSSLPAVVTLGQGIVGAGAIQTIQQALHNAEKLTEPKPQVLRDLNKVRSVYRLLLARPASVANEGRHDHRLVQPKVSRHSRRGNYAQRR